MKAISLAVFTLVFAIISSLAPDPVFAREPVDPATLNPPPPPEFNPVCERVGSQIICDIQFSDPVVAEGSGLTCGSGAEAFEPFVFQTRSVRGKRYYDENGNLLRRHFQEVIDGTFTNPITHKALAFSGSDTHLHVLAVPGDNATGTETVTGSVRIFLGPGNGTLAFDTGRLVYDVADDYKVVAESGQHPILDDFESAVQTLCDALQ
jgi:hypothetical protein